jgi:glycosyltransferase involved in cell wall biosynthesis
MPKVSIVLPTYNGARYLEQSIESCLSQDYENLEIVIVVDGSTDDTAHILQALDDERCIIITNPTNLGLPESLNVGFRRATGELLTWTSDDNLYRSDAIRTMVTYLECHPNIDFVYTSYWEMDEDGTIIRLNPCGPPEQIMNTNSVGPCFLYRRQVYESVGDYDPNTRWFEDYHYWLRVSSRFRMARLEQPLYFYRAHAHSLTQQPGVYFGRARLAAKMKRREFGLSLPAYWEQLAKVDIEEAFYSYEKRLFHRVPLWASRGISRDPRWLRNLGLLSISARSIRNILKPGKGTTAGSV